MFALYLRDALFPRVLRLTACSYHREALEPLAANGRGRILAITSRLPAAIAVAVDAQCSVVADFEQHVGDRSTPLYGEGSERSGHRAPRIWPASSSTGSNTSRSAATRS
jgi:hypothetical protein